MPFNFKGNESLDSLDSVPDEYRPAYAQNADKKFVIKDEYKAFTTAIDGNYESLTKTTNDLKKSNKEAADRRAVIKAYEDLLTAQGVTFDDKKLAHDALKEHLDTLTAQAKNGGELKVNMDNIRKEFEKKASESQAESDQKVAKMTSSLERYLIGDAARAALAEAKGSPELLLPIIRGAAKVVAEGDDYVVRIVDKDGNVRSDGKGGLLEVKGFVSELKKVAAYARAFESETKAGTGVQSKTTQTQVRKTGDKEMTANEKIAAGLASGKYQRGGKAA